MKVETLMTKDVESCSPDDSAERAARILWERDCGIVPVVASNATRLLLGVVTDRDLLMAAYLQGRALKEIRVGDVMSRRPRTCGPSEDLAAAAKRMAKGRVRRLPVVDDAGQLLGMLSLADLAREAARERPVAGRAVKDKQVGRTLSAIVQSRSEEEEAAAKAKGRAPDRA